VFVQPLAAGSALGYYSFAYIGSYLNSYAHTNLGYSRNVVLFVGVVSGLTSGAVVALSAALSAALCDRVGPAKFSAPTSPPWRIAVSIQAFLGWKPATLVCG
jgi:hypothetical protein